jgi:uncharacterized protein YlaI
MLQILKIKTFEPNVLKRTARAIFHIKNNRFLSKYLEDKFLSSFLCTRCQKKISEQI